MREDDETEVVGLDTDKPLVISGAGLAGSLLAVYLAHRGFDVSLYEKRGDLRRAEAPSGRSINLALSERGIHALRGVGLAGRVLREAIPMRGRFIHERDGSTRFLPYGQRPHEFINAVSRTDLNRILLEAAEEAGVTMHFEHEVLDVQPRDRTITIRQPDGSNCTRAAPVVFGADGAGSPVRDALNDRVDLGITRDLLDHGYKELTIPPAVGGGFRMSAEALHIWPRGTHMLIALPNRDGSFTCTLFMATDGDPGFEQLSNEKTLRNFFLTEFGNAVDLIDNLEEEFFSNPTGILGTIRCQKWHAGGSALIVGDAAHAVVPFYGQGMNCAFEDCSRLNRLLGEQPSSWEDCFSRFESDRRKSAHAIADMALENYIEMRDRVADPAFRFRRSLALELEKRYPDLFVPQYSLVSFHRIPYEEAQRIGKRQNDLLVCLSENVTSIDEVDWNAARDELLTGRFAPGPNQSSDGRQ